MEKNERIPVNGEDIPLRELGGAEMTDNNQTEGLRKPINMNHYATKKSAAQSMLDIALLMANSSQLKTVLQEGPDYQYYYPLVVLISLSMLLQITVGLLLIFLVRYDLNDVRKQPKLNLMNDASTVLVFFTVLVNVFITAMGFESSR
ncbi:ninjurin-2 [Lepisosteus oculatus]|uniref:ninjurin-2 n=1 Tax=Lepisosteus oculatus TaxID=7918 RepID=UPI00073FFA09|nr:PREDICTED: ninjurin-2-like [Lepisosteus oculatus]